MPRDWTVNLVAGAVVFALAALLTVTTDLVIADEGWFLQVAARVASGDVLYRDVFFHVTPLSMYLLAGLTKIFGAEMIVLKLTVALLFTAIALAVCRINEQLGAARRYPPLLLLTLFVFASPGTTPLLSSYSEYATLFLLLAFSLFLSWKANPSVFRICAVGIVLGLSFASKQNTGVYGLAAMTAALIAWGWVNHTAVREVLKDIMRVGTAFLVTSLLVVTPVFLSGGLSGLAGYGFVGLGPIVTASHMWYFESLNDLRNAFAHPASIEWLLAAYTGIPFCFVFLAAFLLAAALFTGSRHDRAVTIGVAAFSAAAFAVTFPRADPSHLILATPMLMLAIAYGWRRAGFDRVKGASRIARVSAVLATIPGLIVVTSGVSWRATLEVWSRLPHFHGTLIQRKGYPELESNIRDMAALPRDGRTFLLSQRAGFYYLTSGLKNPTPFDYPSTAGFGRYGIHDIMEAINRGEIQHVCVDTSGDQIIRPSDLEQFVRSRMTPRTGSAHCYSNPVPPPVNKIPPP